MFWNKPEPHRPPCSTCKVLHEEVLWYRSRIEHLEAELLKMKREGYHMQVESLARTENDKQPQAILPGVVIDALEEMTKGDRRLYEEIYSWAVAELRKQPDMDPDALADKIYLGGKVTTL